MPHGDMSGERAAISPSRTALVEVATGRRFTYSELDRRASALARARLVGEEGWEAAEGEVGVAFVVAAGEGTIPPGELEGFLAGRLARFKVPRDFVHVAELPRTPYGKVVKGELLQRYLSEHPGGTS